MLTAQATATGTNEEPQSPRIAYFDDFSLTPAAASFSPVEPRTGQFLALQSINIPLLTLDVSDLSTDPVPTPAPVLASASAGVYSPYPWSCLQTVQYWIKDFPKGVGFPNNIAPTHFYPKVGDAILTTEGKGTGHTGQVIAVNPMVSVTIKECNATGYEKVENILKDGVIVGTKKTWIPTCGIRTLPLNAEQIRGYWEKQLQYFSEYAIMAE